MTPNQSGMKFLRNHQLGMKQFFLTWKEPWKQEKLRPRIGKKRKNGSERMFHASKYSGSQRLAEIVRHNLRTVQSYLLKEEFLLFWEYQSPFWAGRFLDEWCTKTMRSKIEPMKKVAKNGWEICLHFLLLRQGFSCFYSPSSL